jgi:uroporphyrinogen decarboxylase
MPVRAPGEVRTIIRERIETAGQGGGLLLASTHVIEPDVPWQNVLVFFETVAEYGKYGQCRQAMNSVCPLSRAWK